MPRSPIPPQWQATAHNPDAMTQRAGPHQDPLTASIGEVLRVGDGTKSPGLISPSRRMFSTAPAESWCPRVSLKSTSAHQCPACACGQKTTLRALRWRSSRASAPRERPVRQRSGVAVTEEWRQGRRRATWLPEEEQAIERDELSGQPCYATATSGLLRSWWMATCARSGNRLHSVHPCGTPRATLFCWVARCVPTRTQRQVRKYAGG